MNIIIFMDLQDTKRNIFDNKCKHKTSFNKFKWTEIIHCMFFNHNEIEL